MELVSVNACFYVKTWRSNDGFLGDGSFAAGIRATELRPGRDRGTSVITGVSDAQLDLLRWFFVEVDDDTGYDAAADAPDPAVAAYAAARGITEVLHFTTNKGLLGILATGSVLCKDRLDCEKYIEHIFTQNCPDRTKDSGWTGYVNMSISRVNNWMLTRSNGWHATEDLWWVVPAFNASLLADPGVYFVTTNNTYDKCLKRDTGVYGLHALFANSVEWGKYGSFKCRYPGMPEAWTTDPQAEVLYPGEVPVSMLRAIYVREPEHADAVRAMLAICQQELRVPVQHKPEVFT